MQDRSQELTRHFYAWEASGRGWTEFETPVQLEPGFQPFFGHTAQHSSAEDDGQRHSLLSSIRSLFRQADPPLTSDEYEQPEVFGYQIEDDQDLKTYALTFPKGEQVDYQAAQQLLIMLSGCSFPVSFEIIASSTVITIQLVCRVGDALFVQGQTKAFFPECSIKENGDILWEVCQKGVSATLVDYGLRDEFMLPLLMAAKFDPDPLIGLFGTLEQLEDDAYAAVQILFQPTINPWSESVLRSVTGGDGKCFFANAPDLLSQAKEKISSPLFAVSIKIVGIGNSTRSCQHTAEMVGRSVARLYKSQYNSLIPLTTGIDFNTRFEALLLRSSYRLGMLLNSKELATLVHLPSDTVVSSKLARTTRKTKAGPEITRGHPMVLGTNEHHGKEFEVTLSSGQRIKHMHIIGATGTGKSTLVQSMVLQDMLHGNGAAIIDPHGDLVETLISMVPPARMKDVIVIDPADAEYPVGFNILSAHSELEKDILSSDLVAIFKRLSTTWGDQMNSVLANAILAILESSNGGTLVDLRRFLIEKSFRDEYLKTVSDPSIVYYWQKEFPLLKSGSIGPILTRLDTFLRPKLIRNMVAQRKSLDFEDILDSEKILFVKLSQGLIGNENSYLLGTFFITKIYQAAMARQVKNVAARKDFYLYVDEFHNFITPSISQLLAGARKYRVGLILVHQDMQQLVKYDSELASSVAANAGTRICFRLGDTDARRFGAGFSFFEPEDLENLNTGEAVGRVERPEFDFSLTTTELQYPDEATAYQTRREVLDYSRSKYGTSKAHVENYLAGIAHDLPVDTTAKVAAESEELNVELPKSPQSISAPAAVIEDSATKEALVKKKEQTQHRSLQTLIKKMAESRGYKVSIEESTPDKQGRVDVSLERNAKRIACEICITTEPGWEAHNLQKCINAGYDIVIACAIEMSTLKNIQTNAEQVLLPHEQCKVLYLEPHQLFALLDAEIAKDASNEVTVKGYRVKVEYGAVSDNDMKKKKSVVSNAVLGTAKKNQKPK